MKGTHANANNIIIPAMNHLTHLDPSGAAHMVDTSHKPSTVRHATAEVMVSMQPATLRQVLAGQMKKGDVFGVARVAGIQAAKKTSDLIPLCHPLMLNAVTIDFEPEPETGRLRILASCRIEAQTGVEMEAMTAASIAALTIYDMCKALEKGITIGPLRLLEKSGGKTGDYKA